MQSGGSVRLTPLGRSSAVSPSFPAPPEMPTDSLAAMELRRICTVFTTAAERRHRTKLFVEDALGSRPIKMSRLGRWPLLVYRLITSSTVANLYVAISMLHTGIGFYEPPSHSQARYSRDMDVWPLLEAFEIGIVGAYACFCCLELYCNYGSTYSEIKGNSVKYKFVSIARCAFTLLFAVDLLCAIFASTPFFRFTRWLRPWTALLFSSDAMSVALAIVSCTAILPVFARMAACNR